MKVRFLGSGDAFGSGGRFQTCIHVESGASQLLLDCGASSLIAMRRFGVDPQAIDTVILSHLHGDHFGGVPFLILDGQFKRRTRPLLVAGPPGVEKRVREAMEVFFPGSTRIERKFETALRRAGRSRGRRGRAGSRHRITRCPTRAARRPLRCGSPGRARSSPTRATRSGRRAWSTPRGAPISSSPKRSPTTSASDITSIWRPCWSIARGSIAAG